jgi:hypothetical protein
MEEYAMPLIRNGCRQPTWWGFLVVVFWTLVVALLDPGAANAQEVKQIKLTEKHMQTFIAVSEELAKFPDGADIDKLDAELEPLVKRNGFASLVEFNEVGMNIGMIMSGFDQQTKRFTEPSEQIKQQIAALRSDKSVPEAEKKEELAQLEAVLKDTKPIQFKENVALVLKYFDKLAELMQEQGPAD